MTKTATKPVRAKTGRYARTLMSMEVSDTEGPIIDGEKMSEKEWELFRSVVEGCVEAIHRTHAVQQATNMEVFFASTSRSAMFYAGLHVREYRKLKAEFAEG